MIYTTSLYLLHELHHQSGFRKLLYPLTVVIVLCIPLFITPAGYAIFAMAVVYALRLMFTKCYLAR